MILAGGAALAEEAAVPGEDFCFFSPGRLKPPDSGAGRKEDRRVYVPGMSFPLKVGADDREEPTGGRRAFANSQIFGIGGSFGPRGPVNGLENYRGCWADTFCEGKRSWTMPLCPGDSRNPAGRGHQGIDIRPDAPADNTYEAVAFADGIVTFVSANTTVIVRADDGTECRYLHLHPESIGVKPGDRVLGGDSVIGRVSNFMGSRPGTSIHLHFDCRQNLQLASGEVTQVYVPVYSSVIPPYAAAWGLEIGVVEGFLESGTPYERR